jgi:arginine decarboxylase
VGAYQEILGDLHNLFGDTNAVHVALGGNGEIVLDHVIQGDTVREVLDYVQFNSRSLIEAFRKDVEVAVREGKLGYEQAGQIVRFYENGIHGYTYLESVE